MNFKNDLKRMAQNSVSLKIKGKTDYVLGGTRFGGVPDLPEDFKWDFFAYDNDEAASVPLAFIAQFNCEEIAKYDTEHFLPQKGLLSFFYEADIRNAASLKPILRNGDTTLRTRALPRYTGLRI